MLLGEVVAHDPGVEGRRAPLRHLGGVEDHLALGLYLAERWVPDIGRVDVAAREGGCYLRRAQIEDLDTLRIDLLVLQRGEQAVVRRGHEGHRNLLALEVGNLRHAAPVAGYKGFRLADEADDEDGPDGQFAAGGGGQRA